jgi:putative ABC transport system permease protein
VSLLRLAATNLFRNPLRSGLTVAGVAVAVVTFLLLRTVIWAYNVSAEQAVPDRVVTRHKVTFIMPLPKRYIDEVRQIPGVRAATYSSWWGGREPNHPNEFFATLAVDPDTMLEVYDELRIDGGQYTAWKEDRQGAIVGDLLAEKFGWKPGDTVTMESGIFPGQWQFHVSGTYETTRQTLDRQTFFFHWDYFNEMMPEENKEIIGWISSRTNGDPSAVGRAIDAAFDEKDVQTISQDEATFQRSFLAGFSAILLAIDAISIVILGIMALILGNTVAMGVRERTSEYGVLRAIGFQPRHIATLVLGEAVVLGLVGGTVGLLLAFPVVQFGIGTWLEQNMSGFFPYFNISPGNAALAMLLATALATSAAAFPAFQASRLHVIDALRRVA